ncbi:hypothetical protein ACFQS2_14070 [Brachybacterium sp. GCM10030267]|uniref:hypothetical protein n=1 Tax=Brachybacterium sp. GCM10030267 TaxID=3273381 RepID=UPI003613E8ED
MSTAPRPRISSTPHQCASRPDTVAVRLAAAVLTAALLSAVALPARRFARPEEARDSFPFSHYPMFSAPRKAHYWVTHLLGVHEDGSVSPLHHGYLGTGGLNAVRRQVRRRVRDGDGQQIAERVAALIAARDRPADRDVHRVHVVRGRYLVEPFMLGRSRDVFTTALDVRGSADVPGRTGAQKALS